MEVDNGEIKSFCSSATHAAPTKANNSITIIPPTTPHNPNSLFSAAANTHRQFLHPLSPINQLMQHQLASR